MEKIRIFAVSLIVAVFCVASVAGLPRTADAAQGKAQSQAASEETVAKLEEKWGVEPLVIRLTGDGHFLDFRYRVTDSSKARAVLDRTVKAYLKDTETGKVLTVPVTKLGALRGTSLKPKEGKQYFILFSNTGMTVERGHKVTVIVGDFQAKGMTVQ